MNIRYRQLLQEDGLLLRQLILLYVDVFAMTASLPDETYLKNLLFQKNIGFFVATTNDIVIGGLTAYMLPSVYSEASEVYLYDLAVKEAYQRQGIGRRLLDTLGTWCRAHGVSDFFVQASATDSAALDFYHATGGVPEAVAHFSYATGK
ncbi:GNAT family N-acetyltransferase [Niabella drilacis]|uniref:Aminoglycoside 3-N-acetyltransferase I n=1 Tax=Niabella drilacis (strain DSM 25811 / CCM 8410 / CCUG 62505 / LMG 26954 / E90) TaxID=1285928 RepID=A0A1G6Z371_NIADE|nr:GNAT family N-acetyltransferase [Niabella drilacis]SDD97214.1 aminoglycoside 3-N-acetyltransferase I [Niabella drilacis]